MIRTDFSSFSITTVNGQKIIIYYDNNNNEVTREGYVESATDNLYRREINARKALAYIKNLVTLAQFEIVQNDVITHLTVYRNGSDRLISWLKGENSATYGNFTVTGFPSKSYFTTQRQTDLLNILTIT